MVDVVGDVALVKIALRIVKLRFLDIAFQSMFKREPEGVVSPKNFEWNGATHVI